MIDHNDGFAGAEGFVRKRAEATSSDRRVTEGVWQNADEEASTRVVLRQTMSRTAPRVDSRHGRGQRIPMQQPVPLGTLHPPTQFSQSLRDFKRGTDLLSTGLGNHAGAPFMRLRGSQTTLRSAYLSGRFATELISINKTRAGRQGSHKLHGLQELRAEPHLMIIEPLEGQKHFVYHERHFLFA
jgi:hypothetical protein